MTTVVFVPIAIAGVAAFNFVAAGVISVLKSKKPINEEKQVHYFLSQEKDSTIPANSFRLVIVNQKKAWNKAVRVYSKGNSEWVEVKCGDSTGKAVKAPYAHLTYDTKIVTFNGTNDVNLECMKPGTFGVWSNIHSVKIKAADSKSYIGNTVYIFFDNDEDLYFDDTKQNKIGYDKLSA